MAISDKDRKRLWAKSGNRCAICRHELIMTNENQSDFNIGEECHIVSSTPNGPRHESGLENYDSYDNLILLCRNHHKIIDDISNILLFSKERLFDIKSKHEAWVKEKLSMTKKTDRVDLISTGSELAAILSGCYAMERTNDNITNKDDAEYIGSIWQTIMDYIDVFHYWEPYQQIQAEYELQELLDEMSKKGYFMYGKRVSRKMKYANGETDQWPIALLYIRNTDRIYIRGNNVTIAGVY